VALDKMKAKENGQNQRIRDVKELQAFQQSSGQRHGRNPA